MKKSTYLALLAALLTFGLAGCSSDDSDESLDSPNTVVIKETGLSSANSEKCQTTLGKCYWGSSLTPFGYPELTCMIEGSTKFGDLSIRFYEQSGKKAASDLKVGETFDHTMLTATISDGSWCGNGRLAYLSDGGSIRVTGRHVNSDGQEIITVQLNGLSFPDSRDSSHKFIVYGSVEFQVTELLYCI